MRNCKLFKNGVDDDGNFCRMSSDCDCEKEQDSQNPICPYCGNESELVKGDDIYPALDKLHEKNFYLCRPCWAYVGCHAPNKYFGYDGTQPLGRLANGELRKAKGEAHKTFDILWCGVSGHFRSRKIAYNWLANQLQIDVKDCHIEMFDIEMCERVIEVSKAKLRAGA